MCSDSTVCQARQAGPCFCNCEPYKTEFMIADLDQAAGPVTTSTGRLATLPQDHEVCLVFRSIAGLLSVFCSAAFIEHNYTFVWTESRRQAEKRTSVPELNQ